MNLQSMQNRLRRVERDTNLDKMPLGFVIRPDDDFEGKLRRIGAARDAGRVVYVANLTRQRLPRSVL
ncbi:MULTISPECIES: hypothetical protein [unclassified Methylibium]|uniref:hypothetical protein n=1 Tax=unclassified Methylibium TaxID=2633235 RepID=UPI0003F4041C|nr:MULTISPECIES: hypothetical protein [unclassified Methylibium]EWS53164.1 hypothetical protein X551_04038 [Methylibium sp. T29]EWS53231.1 hypothetical protein X551_03973 [Methylibium sp. T29]EWS58309.1 hypothetical protein Y694_03807 [Methylibium sp. T29-B]